MADPDLYKAAVEYHNTGRFDGPKEQMELRKYYFDFNEVEGLYTEHMVKGTIILFSRYSRHSSVTTMLNELDWKSLEKRRDDSILVMFHKIINQYVDIPYDHILHKVPSTTRSSSRKYLHLPSKIDSYMQSFFPKAIRLWYHLPDHLMETDNVDTFKSLLL